MSKNRFDRRRPRAPEQWESDYAALGGGLDEASSGMSVKPGRIAASLNWEEVFGAQGYRSIRGYEKIDNRMGASVPDAPHRVVYVVVPFDAGNAAIAQGTAIQLPDNTSVGIVYSQTITSGTVGAGNAAGYLVVIPNRGQEDDTAWADNDAIKTASTQRALCNGGSYVGSWDDPTVDYKTTLTAVRTYLLGLLSDPSGTGGIMGLAVFNDHVYASRRNGALQRLFYCGPNTTGWVLVDDDMLFQHPTTIEDAVPRFWSANFTGDPSRIHLYMVDGVNPMRRISTDNTVEFGFPFMGSEATSASSVSIGLGAKTFTAVESNRSWVVGDVLRIVSKANPTSSYMIGDVTAYNSGTGQLDVDVDTASGGPGPFTDWYISRWDAEDKPIDVIEHKNHLFLAYRNGQLQTSDLGDPTQATTTAAIFGLGSEFRGFAKLRGEVLAVFTEKGIQFLTGSSATDWNLAPHDDNSSAKWLSIQAKGGNALFLDDGGLNTLQATQEFGDFAGALMSEAVQRSLAPKLDNLVGARMHPNKSQYRAYFDDGSVLLVTIKGGSSTISPKNLSFAWAQYDHVATCFASGLVNGRDIMVFGTDDGHVMHEDCATWFDGEPITYTLRLPFNHFKTPQIIKQFHKLMLEVQARSPDLTLNIRQRFDYEDGTYDPEDGDTMLDDMGLLLDFDSFEEAAFDGAVVLRPEVDLDGQGRNMALLIWFESDFYDPVTLQGVLVNYSKLGLQR